MTPVTNPKLIFMVVIGLCVTVVVGVGTAFFLVMKHVDAAIVAMFIGPATTALGGLMSMLNNTRSQQPSVADTPEAPLPTTIVNSPSQPVPVTPAPKP